MLNHIRRNVWKTKPIMAEDGDCSVQPQMAASAYFEWNHGRTRLRNHSQSSVAEDLRRVRSFE
jgi:hypothetical protein